MDDNKYIPEKIVPNYSSIDSALKACWEANGELPKSDEYLRALFKPPSKVRWLEEDCDSCHLYERSILTEQCEVAKQEIPMIEEWQDLLVFLKKNMMIGM